MSSISIGVLAFTNANGKNTVVSDLNINFCLCMTVSTALGDAQYFAIILLPISLLFVGYALWTYLWRSELIRHRDASRYEPPLRFSPCSDLTRSCFCRWDDPAGPILLTVLLIFALTGQFLFKVSTNTCKSYSKQLIN
jgi:hypothetical protein